MIRKLTSGLVLAATMAVGLTVVATPAIAATTQARPTAVVEDDEWDRLWHFGNESLCEAAGNTGEALELWDEDEWYCDEDGTLYIER